MVSFPQPLITILLAANSFPVFLTVTDISVNAGRNTNVLRQGETL